MPYPYFNENDNIQTIDEPTLRFQGIYLYFHTHQNYPSITTLYIYIPPLHLLP